MGSCKMNETDLGLGKIIRGFSFGCWSGCTPVLVSIFFFRRLALCWNDVYLVHQLDFFFFSFGENAP